MQFETKESAIKAANDLNHVKFDERVVETDYMVLLLDVSQWHVGLPELQDPARMEEVQKFYPEQVRREEEREDTFVSHCVSEPSISWYVASKRFIETRNEVEVCDWGLSCIAL